MKPLFLRMLLAITILLLSGCGKQKETSSTKKAVEDIVGSTTLKQGEMIKNKLKEYEKEQEKREKELDKIK